MRVFITGASSGIGAALARHYAGPHSVVGMAARRAAALDALASSLPGDTACYALDVADSDALERAARDYIARFGTPDLVIANAGISVGTSGADSRDTARWRACWR